MLKNGERKVVIFMLVLHRICSYMTLFLAFFQLWSLSTTQIFTQFFPKTVFGQSVRNTYILLYLQYLISLISFIQFFIST